MKEKLQEERKFIPGVQKEEEDGLLVFESFFLMSTEAMMHVKSETSLFLLLCFFFYLLYLIVSPLVKTNFLDSAHSISFTAVLKRVRRGGFIC